MRAQKSAVRRCATALAAAAVVLACLSCASCKKAPVQGAGTTDAGGSAGELTPEQSAKVIARVGDRTITVGSYVAALQHMDSFDRVRYQSPERRKELLAEMIDVMLLADEARARGYDKDPVTQQEIREVLREAMLKKARADVPGPNEVPDDEVRVYYETHRTDFRDPERRRVSAIVLASEGAARSLLDAAARASGTQWGELVRSRSIDPQAKANVPADLAGDMGFVAPPGDPRGDNPRVPDEVRKAAFQITNVGDVSPAPVKAGGKFYLVRLTSKTDPHDRSLQEAERMIRVRLAQDKAHVREERLLDDLRQQFHINIDEAALAQVKVEMPDAGAR
jgi:parvulin-like peptidyl-prolyl isomerase